MNLKVTTQTRHTMAQIILSFRRSIKLWLDWWDDSSSRDARITEQVLAWMHPTTRPSDPEIGDESVHGVGGVEGVWGWCAEGCPRGGECGRSLSTAWGVWRESVHGVGGVEGVCPQGGGCGSSLSTGGGGVEGVCPRVGGVEGVRPHCGGVWRESVHGVGGVEGVCPRGGGCGGSLSTGWGVWRESVHRVLVWRESVHGVDGVEGVCPRGGRCGRSLSTGWGSVEGVCPRECGGSLSTGWPGGVEGVVLRSDCVEGVCYESRDVEGMWWESSWGWPPKNCVEWACLNNRWHIISPVFTMFSTITFNQSNNQTVNLLVKSKWIKSNRSTNLSNNHSPSNHSNPKITNPFIKQSSSRSFNQPANH